MVSLLQSSKIKIAIAAAFVFTGSTLMAQDALLTLTDNQGSEVVILTEEDLMAFDQFSMLTVNEHVDQITEFVGPLARDVVAAMGAGAGDVVTLTAVNDYAIDVPVDDFLEYDVIFAHSADGKRLSTRDKGPIWVVYPMTDFPELQDPIYNGRIIWQLVSVDLN